MQNQTGYTFLRKQAKWEDLWFYQKADVLYQMTVVFCRRFLPAHGDRTVDQMVQAARSGKQNIVEGSLAETMGCHASSLSGTDWILQEP